MRLSPPHASALCAALFSAALSASASAQTADLHSSATTLATSSSSSDDGSAIASGGLTEAHDAPSSGAISRPIVPLRNPGVRPFSGVAIAVKAGSTGIGFDLSTPLSRHFTIRTGASFFSYNTSFEQDGMNIDGSIHLQSAAASVDFYPFHNSFRISPGLAFRNDTHLDATLQVPGGKTFSFGDGGTYYSDVEDPVHGTAGFDLGRKLAPRMTLGWGNIMPHAGARISFPFELGFQYNKQPKVLLAVTGTACGSQVVDGTAQTGCGPVDQADVAQEQVDLQNDLAPLRFYPVLTFGISVRIGHGRRSE